MKTQTINEELNAASERMNKRLNDEFIRQCVERYKQEQAQQKRRDVEASQATAQPADVGAAIRGCPAATQKE